MTWPYEYTPYISLLLACAIIVAVMGFYAYRDRTVPGAIPFIVLLSLTMLWVIANGFEMAATNDKTQIFWFKIENLLIIPAASAGLCFALEYAGLGKWVNRWTVSFLAILALGLVPLVLTNDAHHLVWTQIWVKDYIHFIRGPVVWVAVLYAYLLSLLHLMVLAWFFIHSLRHRWIIAWLIIAPVSVRAAYFIDILNWNPIEPIDPKIIVVCLAMLPYALAVFRFHMFDVVPIARDTVMERMADGIIALDAKNRIADINEAAQKLFNIVKSKVVGRYIDETLKAYPELLNLVHSSDETQCEVPFGDTNFRWFQMSISPLVDQREFRLGRLILLHDITKQKRIQAQLLDQQKTLAVLREREMLGRELHDGIGQILAAAHLQVKTAWELLKRQDSESVASCLNRLTEMTQEAKESLREYLLGVKARSSPELGLLPALQRYLNHYSREYGIHAELVAPAELEEIRLDSDVEAQLQPIIQEALANVRRHSGSGSARIVFTLRDSKLNVVIEDDGKGFDPEKISDNTGFGLHSMRGRANLMGAAFEIQSTPGEGTRVVLQVPCRKEGR